MGWHGAGAVVRLHELAIPSPLAYVASDRRASGRPLDPSEIIPSLPVSLRGVPELAPPWPSYARLSPEQRGAYLSWLASARAALPRDQAMAMLHLMGLERRALVDGEDLGAVVQEVCRVRDLVAMEMARAPARGEGRAAPPVAEPAARRWASYMRQSGSLLWALVALRPDAFSERDLRVLASRAASWSEEAIAAALAWCVRRGGGTLPPWLALVAAEHAPGARRSVVTQRVPEEFVALFESRLAQKHPGGMRLRVAARERTIVYRAANDTVRPGEARMPDALGIASQFKPLVELWNSCIDDLRALARVADADASPGEGGDTQAMTLQVWRAVPEELRATMDNPFAARLAALAAAHADQAGHAIVTPAAVAGVLGLDVGERTTLTPTMARDMAAAVEDAGMSLEPDARITEAGCALEAPVVLLPTRVEADATDEGRARYMAASAVLRLGAAVALADGVASDQELAPVALELERAFDLTEAQHRRLDALMALLRARGSEVRSVGKRLLAALTPDSRRTVGTLLVAVASADGVIAPAERTALRACYRALGLEAADLDAALASLAAARAGSPGPAGPGAPPAAHAPSLQLDRDAIERITRETREVAQLLADAMRGDEDQPDPPPRPGAGGRAPDGSRGSGLDLAAAPASPGPPAPAPRATASPGDSFGASPTGLHPRFAPFFRAIMARDSWTLDESGLLAREHKVMLAGAVDAINDWSYDLADGPLLIEDGDRLIIDPDRRRMLG
jgi:tellurite resistance protein